MTASSILVAIASALSCFVFRRPRLNMRINELFFPVLEREARSVREGILSRK